jgi:hypothetical protein
MLKRFTIQNFLSFKDETTLNMTAEALKEKKDYLHIPYLYNPNFFLLKSVAIYGYNSYGKSNLIKAYSFFQNLILNSFTLGQKYSSLGVQPFKLCTKTLDEPSHFEVVFILDDTKYRYGFKITNEGIEDEWLYYTYKRVRQNTLFIRHKQDFIEVGKKWNTDSGNMVEQAKMFTQPHNLFLSVLLSQSNIPPHIESIAKWFKGNIILTGDYDSSIKLFDIYSKDEYRNIILKFIKIADLEIETIFDKITDKVNKGLAQGLAESIYNTEAKNFDLSIKRRVLDDNHSFQYNVDFNLHKNESSGTIKYFAIACYLTLALKTGQLIWIDELDASIHNDLLVFLVEIFNSSKNNVRGSQLIFTTHNTTFLDKKLRRDQIRLVDKNEYGESSIHPVHSAKNPIRIDKSMEQEYRQGKIQKGISRQLRNANIPDLFSEIDDTKV